MRHVQMTAHTKAIRVGIVDALLNVVRYKFQSLTCGCGQNILILLSLTSTTVEQITRRRRYRHKDSFRLYSYSVGVSYMKFSHKRLPAKIPIQKHPRPRFWRGIRVRDLSHDRAFYDALVDASTRLLDE